MGAFAVGAVSMIGLPPTAGFLGKWFMLSGAMQAGQWVAVAIIVISTLLNAAYFLPILYTAFFEREPKSVGAAGVTEPHGEAPLPIVIATTATAIATVALFLFPDVPLALAKMMIGE
jgi:multicomponent Na+:H+ antiporter subunit D